jgi:2-keto-3-deoxy-L-rhamnonate aldolase RhmA
VVAASRSRLSLRQRVLDGIPTVGTWIALGSAPAAEIVAGAGFDWVVIDTEHGMGSEADVLAQLYAVATTSAVPLVRVERADRLRIGRMLDLGAKGIVVPRLEGVDEARQAVAWLRLPPAGVRGVALGSRGQGGGRLGHDAVATLNDEVLGVFQVESAAAVAAANELARIDGVDVLFVGPSDLSHALGLPGRFDHPTFVDALRQVVAAARAAGKAAGILARDRRAAERYWELGFRFVGIGADNWFLADGAAAAAAFRERWAPAGGAGIDRGPVVGTVDAGPTAGPAAAGRGTAGPATEGPAARGAAPEGPAAAS